MRTLMLSTAMLSLVAAVPAEAGQRVVQPGPGFGAGNMPRPVTPGPVTQRPNWGGGNLPRPRGGANVPRPHGGVNVPQPHGGVNVPQPHGGVNVPRPGYGHVGGGQVHRPRWGGRVGGRWHGGMRAPGGWASYHRPVRGYVLPSYWVSPRWYVNDWQSYGLPSAPTGYSWSRYYDDAVLIDGRGSVYDTIGGVDWDRVDGRDVDYSYVDGGYDAGAYGYPARRDDGVGGAALGAVAGGVAGNLIAGRGNRLGGTLIGAGVGAAAGYAIDKAEDRGRIAPPPGAGYPAPGGYPQPGYGHPQGGGYAQSGTTVVHSGDGAVSSGGYYADGYYYPGTNVTTVTVSSAPIITTTTTEIYEDQVTYTRPAAARTWKKKTWKPRPRCVCR